MQSETALDLTFRALGDRTRRSMIRELSTHEWRSAGELGERFDSAQPTISKHLKVLEQANLIERSVDGRVHRFRLRRKTLQLASEWIERHQRFWAGAMDQLESMLKESEK
jgi:DNA-binding transcriptional ArsR family regulator